MPRRTRSTVVHAQALRELRVLRVCDVTPGLRRVTFTGEQLGSFTLDDGTEIPPFVSTGFDDDVNLIFPHPGESEPVLPTHLDGRWVSPEPRPLGRHYTVRRHDPATREIDIDFVEHGDGVAAGWAYRAQPGDRLHLGGPSASLGLPEGFDWLLVAGDDTAAPAIARLLDELPHDARAQVFVEVLDPARRQPVRELPGVTVTWLPRDGAAGSPLLDALRRAEWWPGPVFAWVAGEQSVVRDVRRHLVEDRAVPKPHVEFAGYWKRAPATTAGEGPETGQHEAEDRFHEQADLLPPLAIRLAVELGLGELISRGVGTPVELAARTGTVERALRKFLRYLETIGLLASDGDRYRLTDTGEELADDHTVAMLHPDGVPARLERGLFGLGESLRTGRASYAAVTGRDYASLRGDTAFERAYLGQEAEDAGYLAATIAACGALAGVGHVVVRSDVAGAIAAALTERHPRVRVTIAASPAQAAWLREDLPRTLGDPARRARVDVVGDVEAAADAVLLVDRLAHHPDAEAVALLRGAAAGLAPGGRVLLFGETMDAGDVDADDAGTDLLHLAVHGSGYRTDAEVEALITRAGLAVTASEPVPRGDRLRTLVPARG